QSLLRGRLLIRRRCGIFLLLGWHDSSYDGRHVRRDLWCWCLGSLKNNRPGGFLGPQSGVWLLSERSDLLNPRSCRRLRPKIMQWTLRKNRSRLNGTRTCHRSLTVRSKLIENGGLHDFSAARGNCCWLLTTRRGKRSEAQSSISHIGLERGNHWMKVHVRLSAIVGGHRTHVDRT